MVAERTIETRTFNPAPLLIFVLLVVVPFILLRQVDGMDLKYVNHEHATKHEEAEELIRKCQVQDPLQVWKSLSWRTPNKFFCVYKLDDGRHGITVVEWSKKLGGWFLRTAFVVKGGKVEALLEYLSARSDLYLQPLPNFIP